MAGFWLKQLTATHKYLATLFNKLIQKIQILEWPMPGVTILIPKNTNTERPKNLSAYSRQSQSIDNKQKKAQVY
jgi:hypothetical protein